MSSSVAYFIYGVPVINYDGWRVDEHYEFIERAPEGMIKHYSGNGTYFNPAGFGIQLYQLSEGDHHAELGNMRLTATEQEMAQYQVLWDALKPEDQALLSDQGKPRVFILWGSS